MLLYNKSIVRIKGIDSDTEQVITWEQERGRLKVYSSYYVNGYYESGRSMDYYLEDLDELEEIINDVGDGFVVEAYR